MADRNLERNRRRYLRGKGFGIEGHENGIFAFVNAVGEADVGNLDLGMVVVDLGRPLKQLAGSMAFQDERGDRRMNAEEGEDGYWNCCSKILRGAHEVDTELDAVMSRVELGVGKLREW